MKIEKKIPLELSMLLNCMNEVIYFDMTKKTRKREYVVARRCFCYIANQYTKYSLATIGSVFNQDHATVLHAIKMHVLHKDLAGTHDIVTKLLKVGVDFFGINHEDLSEEKNIKILNRRIGILEKEKEILSKKLFYFNRTKGVINNYQSKITAGLKELTPEDIHEFMKYRFDVFVKSKKAFRSQEI